MQELQLRPHMQVRVILLQPEEKGREPVSNEVERARQRHEAIQDLLALRAGFAGMNFNLTDELVRMREMEDE
jgi:hypothetical protein